MPEPKITWNTQIHVFACFLVQALPEVWGQNRKQFFDKVLYNYCLKKNCGAFWPKKWISHRILKKWFGWGGGLFFCQHFFLKKPNTLEYAQVLVVTWAKPNSVTALLSPRPTLAPLWSSTTTIIVSEPSLMQTHTSRPHLNPFYYLITGALW